MTKKTSHNKQPGREIISSLLWPIFRKHRKRLFAGVLALLGVDFLQLCIPRILKNGVDSLAAGSAQQDELLFLALLICAIGASATILRFCWRYLIIGFSRYLERDIRKKIFNHVMLMDGSFFGKYSTGSIMAHTSNDLAAVQMACGMGLVAALDALVMATAAIGFMFAINVKLTLLALAPMPFLAIATRILSGRLHKRFDLVQDQFSTMTEFVRSSISAIRLLKAYTLEKSQTKRFADIGQEYVQSSIRVAIIQGLLFPVATMVGSFGMLLVLYFGGQLVMQQVISMGDFVAFVTYLYMLIWPIMAVGWVANLSQRGLTSLRRISTLLGTKSKIPAGLIQCPPDLQTFKCKNLNFTYPGTERRILSNIDLHIRPGILGLCGPTGCGKTSLCQILARMFPVANSTLFAGREDVNLLNPESVQQNISYVGQEPLLFSSTIAENINFGVPDATREEIVAAAKAAAIHDEIMHLAAGYDSYIGEKGVNLSGGQRQRIAFARALACDRPIMIIDDALAAVDTATEQEILKNVLPLLRKKTVVWVSQRIKQLSQVDKLLVMEEGKISSLGSYQELCQTDTFLREIRHRQSLVEEVEGNVHA
jgi:ATP-binding cassette, subfamily B, multidrug efflux pump